ncbi:MAG: malto-oligosyltrehalose trehalohydrolase [Chthoniobacterales bacterium]
MSARVKEFAIWVPAAKTVSIVLDDASFPMNLEKEGWWRIALPQKQKEVRYRFSIDDGAPIPDPRSPWQPDGVHGASCILPETQSTVTKSLFRARPLPEAVIYELHVGTFTPEGTYTALSEKLPYLCDLGVTHIELMPLATFPGKWGWGYDGVSLYAPHPAYGTPADLKKFIQDAHDHKIAVILDVVYNHLGPDGNYLPQCGPYFTDRWKTPWGDALNFDGANSGEIRNFFFENAIMWLRDYEFDGLRLDAIHAISDTSAVHFLEELMSEITQFCARDEREIFVVAESDLNDPRVVRDPSVGGYGVNAHWIDDFHHALHACFTEEKEGYYSDFGKLSQVAKALKQGYVYDGEFSSFRKRRHGRAPLGVSPVQLVVFSQNHDQIGNRAFGERLSMLVDLPKLKAIAALTLLSPFIPMLFQGEEWGANTPFLYFTNHPDKKLGKLVTKGRREEFSTFNWKDAKIPDPQSEETFKSSKLQWNETEDENHHELLQWYKMLIRLRQTPKMLNQSADVVFDEKQRWLTFKNGRILVLLNLKEKAQKVPIPPGDWKVEMSSVKGVLSLQEPLPALCTAICSKNDTAKTNPNREALIL